MFSVTTLPNSSVQSMYSPNDMRKKIEEHIELFKRFMQESKARASNNEVDAVYILDLLLWHENTDADPTAAMASQHIQTISSIIQKLCIDFENKSLINYATQKNIVEKIREITPQKNGTMQGIILLKNKRDNQWHALNFFVSDKQQGNRIYFLDPNADFLLVVACPEAQSFKNYMAQFKDNMMFAISVSSKGWQNILSLTLLKTQLQRNKAVFYSTIQNNQNCKDVYLALVKTILDRKVLRVNELITRYPWLLQYLGNGHTGFTLASKLGYLEIMELMYKHNPKVIDQTALGVKSALMLAMQRKKIQAAIFILEHHPAFLEPNHKKLEIFVRTFWFIMSKNLNAYHQEAMINAFKKAADLSPFAECIHRQFDYLIRPSNYDKKTPFSAGVNFARSYELLMRNNHRVSESTQYHSHSMNSFSGSAPQNTSPLLWSAGTQLFRSQRNTISEDGNLSSAYSSSVDEEFEFPLQEPVEALIRSNPFFLRRMNDVRTSSSNNPFISNRKLDHSSVGSNSKEETQMDVIPANLRKHKRIKI